MGRERHWRGCGAAPRLAAALEGLNDDHAATTARARTWQDVLLIGRCGIGCPGILRARRCGEQLAGAVGVGCAVGPGEQSGGGGGVAGVLWAGAQETAAAEL